MILSDYAENKLLDLIFSGTTWATKPSTLYYALFTSAPGESGGGTEVSGSGYARVAAPVGVVNFSPATSNGAPVTNLLAVTFPTALASWGTITSMGIFDASTGGNLIAYKTLPSSLSLAQNQTASWGVADLSFDTGGALGAWMGKTLLNYLFCGNGDIENAPASKWPTIPNHFFALCASSTETALTTEPVIGTNGYTRKSMANSAAVWPAAVSGAKTNGTLIQFPPSSGTNWYTTYGVLSNFAILAAAGGTITFVDGDVTVGTDLITKTHAFAVGDIVQLSNSGGALPAGLAENKNYYVVSVTGTTSFKLSATPGGAAVDITAAAGGGTHTVTPQIIWQGPLDSPLTLSSVGDQPQFAVAALAVSID